jgi:hypothetical protein
LRECFAPKPHSNDSANRMALPAASHADLATGGTRFEAALGLHAKQQLHREQLTTISFTKMPATRRIRSF